MQIPSLLMANLLVLASGATLAQTQESQDQTAPMREPGATVLAPVTVKQRRERRDQALSPFVWESIGATGTIRTDILRAWFANEKPQLVRTADAAPAPAPR